jgi:dihydrofolate reductase
MGRRTLEHIGRPLPQRTNIVLTRGTLAQPGVVVVHSVETALEAARHEATAMGTEECVVVGGGEVYRAFLPLVGRLYLTVVEGDHAGNTRFPTAHVEWSRFTVTATETYEADTTNPHTHTFWQLDRDLNGTPVTLALLGLV